MLPYGLLEKWKWQYFIELDSPVRRMKPVVWPGHNFLSKFFSKKELPKQGSGKIEKRGLYLLYQFGSKN